MRKEIFLKTLMFLKLPVEIIINIILISLNFKGKMSFLIISNITQYKYLKLLHLKFRNEPKINKNLSGYRSKVYLNLR